MGVSKGLEGSRGLKHGLRILGWREVTVEVVFT